VIIRRGMDLNISLRQLPSVDEVLRSINAQFPRELLVTETRRVLDRIREQVKSGESVDVSSIPEQVLIELNELDRPSLRRVINATGVVLHTNLGRAPLHQTSGAEAYCNLEYDLETGKRGKRDVHTSLLIERLTGYPGIVVNNNAAAVFLILNELAAGGEVIISRGEMIEIGDGFRIPDIMARAGVILREVGTTNRTRLEDYGEAISDRTRLILKVHPSNFRMSGFTDTPPLAKLAALAREHSLTVYEDLGSGCLVDLKPFGIEEPVVADSMRAGVDVVSFSGDKLLGGPQAGIITGKPDLVARIRRNPLFRAFRAGKLVYQQLEATLRCLLFSRWDEIPALRMITRTPESIRIRAERFAGRMPGWDITVSPGRSVIGGGSTPEQSLPTWVLAIAEPGVEKLEQKLRLGTPAVVARIEDDRLTLDLRTVFEEEEEALRQALFQARSR
jgi:L-seryl-tRNA(Ser) seleniumtransferase